MDDIKIIEWLPKKPKAKITLGALATIEENSAADSKAALGKSSFDKSKISNIKNIATGGGSR